MRAYGAAITRSRGADMSELYRITIRSSLGQVYVGQLPHHLTCAEARVVAATLLQSADAAEPENYTTWTSTNTEDRQA